MKKGDNLIIEETPTEPEVTPEDNDKNNNKRL